MSGKRKVGLPDGVKAKKGLKAQIQRTKKRLSRSQFESLLSGDWEKVHGDRARINGPFVTTVRPGSKLLLFKDQRITKRTWLEIAKELLLKM